MFITPNKDDLLNSLANVKSEVIYKVASPTGAQISEANDAIVTSPRVIKAEFRAKPIL